MPIGDTPIEGHSVDDAHPGEKPLIPETVATRPGDRRVGGFRLFACKKSCPAPKSPRSVATFCLSLYYQNATGLQFLGEGGTPNARISSPQVPRGPRQKTFRR